MASIPPPDGPRPAETLFANWLARRGVVAAGPHAAGTFEALLAAHPEHAAGLRELHAHWTARALDAPSGPGSGASELMLSLQRKSAGAHYSVEGEIARGGMGAILRVWDEDLRRHIAMKVALGAQPAGVQPAGAQPASGPAGEPSVDPRMLARFLEEAQVTGQLDHPGVVPVHELGLDAEGRAFFTMKLVKGRDLRAVYELVFGGHEGWNETRALSVLLKVCEAVAYAHRKGVIHRDLKPGNVMVGDFGEVYVMDWGLARVVGRKDRHDLRLAPEALSSRSVRTERRDEREEAPDSPIITMDGDVVGTPAYMSPEQARGAVEELDARTDVYAIGALLYHLLARQMPYVRRGARVSNRTVLGMVLLAPPEALHSVRKDLPAELVAICEKAMARDAGERYADTLELAEDLRAYLEHRVVRAYRTGALVELQKWVGRNKGSAAALAALVLGALAGVLAYSEARARAERRELHLIDARLAQELLVAEPHLWPALPVSLGAMDAWLGDARGVLARSAGHAELLRELERETPGSTRAVQMGELVRSATPALERALGSVAERAGAARTVEERTVSSGAARARWQSAIDGIAASPRYDGLRIVAQIGLLPLAPDPQSGLWEFWHVATGAEPVRDPTSGRWRITGETGIVLVLLPGCLGSVGSREMALAPGGTAPGHPWDAAFGLLRDSPDWGAEFCDPAHDPLDEAWIGGLPLDPCFVSKYEMTKGQWVRLMASNPSQRQAQRLELPIETVNWYDASEALRRADLVLPTEAQWEYACRAGTNSPFWTGWELASLVGAANVADQAFSDMLGGQHGREVTLAIDDGLAELAPVDALEPNPFGLHHVHGNVWEWCRDIYRPERTPRAGDGLDEGDEALRMSGFRGGAFDSPAHEARSANRFANFLRDNNDADLGLRPARGLTPPSAAGSAAPK